MARVVYNPFTFDELQLLENVTSSTPGPIGAMGPPGDDGEEGAQGPPGATGAIGATGATGATGETGPIGMTGPPGLDGLDGEDGLMGPAGPAGAQGPAGPMGPRGFDGESFENEPALFNLPTNPTSGLGVANQVAFWSSPTTLAGNIGLTYAPLVNGGVLTLQGTSANEVGSFVNNLGTGDAALFIQTQSGGGDAHISFVDGGTTGGWTLGADNSADVFALSAGGTLGASNVLSVAPTSLVVSISKQMVLQADADTFTASTILLEAFPSGITLGTAGALGVIRAASDITMTGNPSAFGTATLFNYQGNIKNSSGTAITMGPVAVFVNQARIRAVAAAITLNDGAFPGLTTVWSNPRFDILSAGTGTAVTAAGLYSSGNVGSGWTLTDFYGTKVTKPGGTGTITNLIAIDIDSMGTRGGTINLGIRNADRTAFTPSSAQAISAVGNTILSNATYVMVSNTTAGSLTLTSTPTIANGQDGQVVIIMSTGTQNVVVQDQGTLAGSNLRLGAANRTLGPRDSLALIYSGTVGDWVELFFSNVV